LVIPPCVGESDFLKLSDKMQDCISLLRRHLPGSVPIDAKDAVMPDSMFFDTEYHLNSQGRALRTKSLLPVLKKALAEPRIERLTQSVRGQTISRLSC
jgi:hypothetical protein